MLVMGSGHDSKCKKYPVGSEYFMAYFVLRFIVGGRKIISELVCDESTETSAFVDVCGGGCHC
jgi:hypothetical protein